MWGSLKNRTEREELIELVNSDAWARDYFAIFVKRVKGVSFFLVKYGVATIWGRSSDEEWYDGYNWYVKLYAKENGSNYKEIEDEGFLTYGECMEIIERLTDIYPQRFFEDTHKEEKTTELPEYAKFIVSQAILDLRKGVPLNEVKAKVAGTAIGADYGVQKQAFKLLEMAARR